MQLHKQKCRGARIVRAIRFGGMAFFAGGRSEPIRHLRALRFVASAAVATGAIAAMHVLNLGEAPRDATVSSAVPAASAATLMQDPSPSTPTAPPASIPGLISREDAIAKAPLPAGDSVTRVEAKLVAPVDLAAAGNGIGGIRDVDYIWVVARWGRFAAGRFGAPLVTDKQQQQPTAPPDGWRFLLIDARTGDAYVGGGSALEGTWWSGLRDRSRDVGR